MSTGVITSTAPTFQGELQELYRNACACTKKEVELVVACVIYRVRHPDRPRVKVSKDILSILEAAGCAARKKICGCSLGMYAWVQAKEPDERFGDPVSLFATPIANSVLQTSYRTWIEATVAELQARHVGKVATRTTPLSLRKLYQVFAKWTTRHKANQQDVPAPATETPGAKESSVPEVQEQTHSDSSDADAEGTGNESRMEIDSRDDSNEPERYSEVAEDRIRSLATSTDSRDEDEEEEPEEDVTMVPPRKRLRASLFSRRCKERPPREASRQNVPTSESAMTRTRGEIGRKSRPKVVSEGEEEEEEESEEEEETTADGSEKEKPAAAAEEEEEESDDEDLVASTKSKPTRIKLRIPFRPPKDMQRRPCWSNDGGRTWQVLPWDKSHELPGGSAWIQPISKFFASVQELERLKAEDRDPDKVIWRQDFQRCYGVCWPLRHIGTFIATKDIEGSVSHRSTGKEGRHLLLQRSSDFEQVSARRTLLERLNGEWKKDLGRDHVFNAVQSNLYSGNFTGQEDGGSSLDHITFHKDGRCKVRGPPILSGCYSNVSVTQSPDTFAAFLIHHQDPDEGVRVWIPQISGTGYAFGGKHCHKKFYHGKYLFGEWKAYHHHVSITFSCYHPWQKGSKQSTAVSSAEGVRVSVDWNLTAEARLWARRYLLGTVSKSACHPEVRRANARCIKRSNYQTVWGAWDEFANTSILQLLQLHPADGGQGIAGNRDQVAVSVLVMRTVSSSSQGTLEYPNRVTLDRATLLLRVEYYSSVAGKRLLKRAKKECTQVRVFLGPDARRAQFAGDSNSVLLLPLMTVVEKDRDASGIFFVLEARLAPWELVHVRKS